MWYRLRTYLQHRLHAKGRHGVHSPFVYEFVTLVLPHVATPAGARIDALRRACARDRSVLEIEDFGAGYGGEHKPVIHKALNAVVRSSARSRRSGELLQRLCAHYAPQQVLELGTNLGFSAMYLWSGMRSGGRLVTVEGSKTLAEKAGEFFGKMDCWPQQFIGEFDRVLQQEIDWHTFRPDLVLLDGNHRKAATLKYFEFLLPRVAEGAIILVDDINWSAEMGEAWAEIAAHPRATVTLDLWEMGICFLDRPQAKEHFRLG